MIGSFPTAFDILRAAASELADHVLAIVCPQPTRPSADMLRELATLGEQRAALAQLAAEEETRADEAERRLDQAERTIVVLERQRTAAQDAEQSIRARLHQFEVTDAVLRAEIRSLRCDITESARTSLRYEDALQWIVRHCNPENAAVMMARRALAPSAHAAPVVTPEGASGR